MKKILPPAALAVTVLAGWQIYVAVSGISEQVLPSPVEVARAFVNDAGTLWPAAWTTLSEILAGYAIAAAVGCLLALGLSFSRLLEHATYPWLVISQVVPVPAIAALVVVWAGFGIAAKLVVVALVSFFPIAVNAIDGLRASDPALLEALASLGAGRTAQLRLVRVPTALPYIFSGLRIAAVLAVIGAVFAEWVGSSSGLGYLILTYNNEVATPAEFAAIGVLALIAIALFAAVSALERVALPWRRTTP
jgi:ABC-type nitrate/sulfonate/bicarbonate transport system permease component